MPDSLIHYLNSKLMSTMEAPFLSSFPLLSPYSCAPSWCQEHLYHTKKMRIKVCAAGNSAYDGYSGGRLVDEGMVVLRKRIHEMKMVERNYEPPAHWMDWEKRCYASYDADVCEAVGAVQALLMNTRPSLALGVMALVTLSVPTSMFMAMSQLIEVGKGILSGG